VLDSFSPSHQSTSAKDGLPFNKSKISTVALQLSTVTFALSWGHHLLFGKEIFTKSRAGKHSSRSHGNSNTPGNNVGLMEGIYFFIHFDLCLVKTARSKSADKAS
jgi:hypothetical protein